MECPEPSTIQVVVIDDDVRLQAGIRDFLESYGYKVFSLHTGKDALRELLRLNPDIALLDVMLPGEDGFSLLQQLRSVSRIPVIMLTALGDETNRIVGLEMGADDYLPKPFNPRELLARIKAVLRRIPKNFTGEPPFAEISSLNEVLVLGNLILDSNSQQLCRGGKELFLSTTEFRIVSVFMDHAGEVLARDKILTLAFGPDYCASDRNIDVYINRIRKRLRSLGESSSRIRTVWGSGYCWTKGD